MAIPTEPTLSTRMRSLGRAEGRNACQFAAYVSGTKVTAEKSGEAYDYRHRIGVEFSDLVTPEGAPDWAQDRERLWNRVEATETRKNSQLMREFRFGFSYDLTADQRRDLAHQVAARFAGMKMCVDVAVHRYSQAWQASDSRTAEQVAKWQSWGIPFVDAERSKALNSEHVMVRTDKAGNVTDYRLFQPHCHCLMVLRPLTADGLGFEGKTEVKEKVMVDGKATWQVKSKSLARQWNETLQKGCDELREWITGLQNDALAGNGSPRRIDARGYEVRRAEALDLAQAAKSAGREEEAARQEARAAMLHREPEPRLGVALRIKQFSDHVRDRFSAWVAVRHRNRITPQIDALWSRDPVDFVTKAHHLLELASRNLGLVASLKPAFEIAPPDQEAELDR